MEWLYAGLGGLRVKDDAVAFREFVIRPRSSAVKSAAVTYHSSYGMIRSEWKLSGESFLLDRSPCRKFRFGLIFLHPMPPPDHGERTSFGREGAYCRWKFRRKSDRRVPSGSYHFQMAKASL